MKKNVLRTGLISLSLIAVLGTSHAVFAEDNTEAAATAAPSKEAKQAKTPKIIVIDVQRIMTESDAAKTVRSQVADLRKSVQSDVSKQETSLRADEQTLVQQQSKISQEDFNTKRVAFEQKVATTRRSVDSRMSSMNNAVNKASGKIEQELQKVLFEMAKAQGAGLIIPKQAVLVAESTMDFTDQAMSELNKRLPRVDVTMEKASSSDDKKSTAAPAKTK